jgi:hypothetical protein
MTYSFDLQPSDFAAASLDFHGGWSGLTRAYLAPGFFVAAIVFLIAYGWTARVDVSLFAGGASWGLYVGWALRACRRAFAESTLRATHSWMFGEREIRVTDLGVESSGASQRSFHAWSLVKAAVVGPQVIYFRMASGVLVVLPARAVDDRRALIERLRARCTGVLKVHGCRSCGYDMSRGSSGACPECGTS